MTDDLDPVVLQLRAWADDLASRTGTGRPAAPPRPRRRVAPWLAGALVAAALASVVVLVASDRVGERAVQPSDSQSLATVDEGSGVASGDTTDAPAETVAPPSTAPSTSAEIVPATTLPASERPPAAFGESIMLGAVAQLQAGGFRVNAAVSRQGEMTAEVIEHEAALGAIGNVVVIHAGTNGPIAQTTFDEMMSSLVDVPQVVVLTVHADRGWVAENNAIIWGLPFRYPNVTVLDWDGLVASGAVPGMAGDGIHLATAAAQQTYANYIFGSIGRNDLIRAVPTDRSSTVP